jgi:hypothetical protein
MSRPICPAICNEFITMSVGGMRLHGRMSAKLKLCFIRHAVPLTFVRRFVGQVFALFRSDLRQELVIPRREKVKNINLMANILPLFGRIHAKIQPII